MEGAITAGGAKSSVLGMEGDGVDGVDVCVVSGCLATVAFEREIGAVVRFWNVNEISTAFLFRGGRCP